MSNILITGASSGIGRALALSRAASGDRVWATVRCEADADALRRDSKGAIRPLLMDLCNAASLREACDTLKGELGDAGLQALVNNAGIVEAGPLEALSPDVLRRQLEVNLIGPMALSQNLLPALRVGRGRILQIGSISGQLTVPFLGAYSLSKQGLAVASRALRMELTPWNIPVCLVVLGNYRTPLWDKALKREPVDPGPYGRYLERAVQLAEEQVAAAGDVDVAVRAICRALDADRPQASYLVGGVPKLIAVVNRLLPETFVDRALIRLYKLHSLPAAEAMHATGHGGADHDRASAPVGPRGEPNACD
jgi:NAD(P)-dependent dehydrogenase (short-subunit alcohol dehydrogenase family)